MEEQRKRPVDLSWPAAAVRPVESRSRHLPRGRRAPPRRASLGSLGLYYSVLAAIAQGSCRRSEIAGVLGRAENALAHPLAVLEQTQLIERVDDAFRRRRPVYRIAEPVLRLHQLIIAPNEPDLVGGAGSRVWQDSADTVRAKIYGPHFEELARQWCLWHADQDTLGDRPSVVQPGQQNGKGGSERSAL
jgi:uncharacterized protein